MSAASERVPEPIVRAAIEWQMRLRDSGSAELYEPLQEWLQRDARHRLAWRRLQQMGGHSIPLLRRAEADLSRRRTLKLLGFALLAGSATLST